MDVSLVTEAFLHHINRKIDSTGCFSFAGYKYGTSTALCGCIVEISYDPMNTETITVNYDGMEPIKAERVRIGVFADKEPTACRYGNKIGNEPLSGRAGEEIQRCVLSRLFPHDGRCPFFR